MESMQYAEAVVKEFLLFRGFTHTLHSFDAEVEADVGHGFQVDRILDLLFTQYVPRFEADDLVKLMAYLQQSFIASADAQYNGTFRKLDVALKKYYIVSAIQRGHPDKVLDFFEKHGDSLLRNGREDDWHSWFALPYMKHPSTDPRFQVYFSKEWLDTLIVSFRNFLSEVSDSIRLPVLLRLHNERMKSRALRQDLENLRADNVRLQATVKSRDDEITKLISDYQSARSKGEVEGNDRVKKTFIDSDHSALSSVIEGDGAIWTSLPTKERSPSEAKEERDSDARLRSMNASSADITPMLATPTIQSSESFADATSRSWSREDEVPHVIVESQVGWKRSLGIRALSQDVGFPRLDQTLRVLQWMEPSGYGPQIRRDQHPGMQPYIVEPRSWLWNGRTNLTVWFC